MTSAPRASSLMVKTPPASERRQRDGGACDHIKEKRRGEGEREREERGGGKRRKGIGKKRKR